MPTTVPFTLQALRLAAKGEPIPVSECDSHMLPGLLWSGYFIDISQPDDTRVYASLSERGRAFLEWLET